MSQYRKVDTRIWNDARFCGLSDDGKLVFLMLLTHPNMTSLGAMRATLAGLAEEIGWESERLSKGFGEGLAKGMVEHDRTGRMIGLPNFLKYNAPENPNVLRSWVKAFDLLPECQLKAKTFQRLKTLVEGLSEPFRKAFGEAFPKGMAIQEQEPEQEPEPKQELYPTPSDAESQDRAQSAPKRVCAGGGKPTVAELAAFDGFWAVYPLRKGKDPAREAFVKALRSGVPIETIMLGAQAYAGERAGKDPAKTKYAQGWLNDRRWEDEALPAHTERPAVRNQAHAGFSAMAYASQLLREEEAFD